MTTSVNMMICPHCGSRGTARTITPSSFPVEIGVWVVGLVMTAVVGPLILFGPLGFTIWRGASAKKGCYKCQQAGLIPLNTPAGQALAEKYPAEKK